MRKVFVLLLAVSLFASCKDNKQTDRRNDRNNERDDYRNDDRNNDRNDDRNSRNSDYDDNNSNSRNNNNDDSYDNNNSRSSRNGWSSAERNAFVDNCVPEAEKNGLTNRQATQYCECMQKGIEEMYPDPNDAANLDMNSSKVKRMVQDCAPRQ